VQTHIARERIRFLEDGIVFPLTIAGAQGAYATWFRVDDGDLREYFGFSAETDIRQHFARIIPVLERAARMAGQAGKAETGFTMNDAIFVDIEELKAAA
jgi:hypothetical protein